MKVKICGITRLADAEVAVECGAGALGFILHPKSPRYIAPREAQKIIEALPPFVERVAVLVNPSLEEIKRMAGETAFSLWQLHGNETAEFCRSLRPGKLIKALSLPTKWSAEALAAFPVSAFLLDTPCREFGGSGQTFDWNLVEEFRRLTARRLILSGGLRVENIAEAVRRVQPYAVDVSSGVEQSPGVKDHEKLKEFLQLCHSL